MIKKSCPYCESVCDVKEITQKERITYKGKPVTYEAVHYECCNCHEVFDSAEMMDKNLLSVREAYEELYEKIAPKQITSIRELYNASQKAFSLILGMGELTINSYEQGKSVPNSSNGLLLHLAKSPLIFFEMYEKNKHKIGIIQQERIESSQAYINCRRWGGLENLYNSLSSAQRHAIEGKTYVSGDSVTHIVTDMLKSQLNKSSFEIYENSHDVDFEDIETENAFEQVVA